MTTVPLLKDRTLQPHRMLGHALWGTDAAAYRCTFDIGHLNTGLLLNFEIDEPVVTAKKRPFNDNVHLDNCVEMFLRFENDEGYYNIEINCLGSVKAAYGPSRDERTFLPLEHLRRIQDDLRITIHADAGGAHWKIAVWIDLTLFSHTPMDTLKGARAGVNFTKCGGGAGDNYLSWVHIDTSQPDFHCPEFFRTITFE